MVIFSSNVIFFVAFPIIPCGLLAEPEATVARINCKVLRTHTTCAYPNLTSTVAQIESY